MPEQRREFGGNARKIHHSPGTPSGAQEKGATPEEVVQKVKQAASYLAKEKEAGLATFKQEQSDYVWADTYVFVADCVQKKCAASVTP